MLAIAGLAVLKWDTAAAAAGRKWKGDRRDEGQKNGEGGVRGRREDGRERFGEEGLWKW